MRSSHLAGSSALATPAIARASTSQPIRSLLRILDRIALHVPSWLLRHGGRAVGSRLTHHQRREEISASDGPGIGAVGHDVVGELRGGYDHHRALRHRRYDEAVGRRGARAWSGGLYGKPHRS